MSPGPSTRWRCSRGPSRTSGPATSVGSSRNSMQTCPIWVRVSWFCNSPQTSQKHQALRVTCSGFNVPPPAVRPHVAHVVSRRAVCGRDRPRHVRARHRPRDHEALRLAAERRRRRQKHVHQLEPATRPPREQEPIRARENPALPSCLRCTHGSDDRSLTDLQSTIPGRNA